MNLASIVSLVVTLLVAVASTFSAPVAAFWAAHGDVSVIFAALYAAAAHFLPAPSAKALVAPKVEL